MPFESLCNWFCLWALLGFRIVVKYTSEAGLEHQYDETLSDLKLQNHIYFNSNKLRFTDQEKMHKFRAWVAFALAQLVQRCSRALPSEAPSNGDRSEHHQCERFTQRRWWMAIWQVGSILHLCFGKENFIRVALNASFFSVAAPFSKSGTVHSCRSSLGFSVLAPWMPKARWVAYLTIRTGPKFSAGICNRHVFCFCFNMYIYIHNAIR